MTNIKFAQEEIEQLLTEMFKSYDIERELYDSFSQEYDKEEDDFMRGFRYKERELRMQFYVDMIDKLVPYSEEVTTTKNIDSNVISMLNQ